MTETLVSLRRMALLSTTYIRDLTAFESITYPCLGFIGSITSHSKVIYFYLHITKNKLIKLAVKSLWAQITIMPLGDSITRGSQSTGVNGYRRELKDLLVSSGYDVNFVGSLRDGAFVDNQHELIRFHLLMDMDVNLHTSGSKTAGWFGKWWENDDRCEEGQVGFDKAISRSLALIVEDC